MKIKMNTLAAGPDGVKQPDKVYDVSDAEGKELVAGGFAVEVKQKPTVEPAPEMVSLDVFSELKADEQKALLAKIGVEGDDSNAEKRLALYTAYIESN